MKVQIFDVEHGQCSLVTTDTGARLLVDCGHNSTTGWRPSVYLQQLGVSSLDALMITNYDEDHASDLPNLRSTVAIPMLYSNPTVSGSDVRKLKASGGIGNGIAELAKMKDTYTGAPATTPNYGISIQTFWNSYPGEFDDENNLSMVTILAAHGFKICFSGDVEVAGWKGLLEKPGFKDAIGGVNVFIASHHGRQNGCCVELFDETHLHPEVTIISDAGKQHASQETVNWYAARTRGINLRGNQRKVITTRHDGRVLIHARPGGTSLDVTG